MYRNIHKCCTNAIAKRVTTTWPSLLKTESYPLCLPKTLTCTQPLTPITIAAPSLSLLHFPSPDWITWPPCIPTSISTLNPLIPTYQLPLPFDKDRTRLTFTIKPPGNSLYPYQPRTIMCDFGSYSTRGYTLMLLEITVMRLELAMFLIVIDCVRCLLLSFTIKLTLLIVSYSAYWY